MAENSKIEWTHHTFNPWVGCSKVSPGCDHCYAEAWAKRSGLVEWGDAARRRTSKQNWNQPLKWDRAAELLGIRQRVFCASLADVFDNVIPDGWREDLFRLILRTPRLDWLLLTKRIGNAESMLPVDWGDGYPNVWIGATVINQAEADRDVHKLTQLPARIRFLSCEPLLGPVRIARLNAGRRSSIHWIICGGESGPGARPMEPIWCADLRADAERNDISFFMKQGSQANWPTFKDFDSFPPALRVREFPQ